jgi:hypothetical protein
LETKKKAKRSDSSPMVRERDGNRHSGFDLAGRTDRAFKSVKLNLKSQLTNLQL